MAFIYPCTSESCQVSCNRKRTFFQLVKAMASIVSNNLLPHHQYLAARRTWRSRLTPSSCTLGWTASKWSQIIANLKSQLGWNIKSSILTRTHWTALLWSPLRTQTFWPFSAFQMWIRPSVEPLMKRRHLWWFSWRKDLIDRTWSRTGNPEKRRPLKAGFSSSDGPWTTVLRALM